MTTIADLFTKYNCTNCQDDIQGIRVHCAECENFDLCLQCFAAGAEIGAHQNNHAYQFMDTGTAILSVFRGKGAWTAREEIRLLDAIEQYGFGNWEDISKHIETKSAEDAKEEYVNKFVNGTIGRLTWTPAQSQRPRLIDHTADDAGPLGANALARLPPLEITSEEALQLGYMPNRDSFEREYDPTAEQLISNITLNSEDTEIDVMLKLAHVDMYTRRLRERARRKRMVRDYQLVSNFFRNRNYALHPGMTKEQKEFRDRFRVFAQFYTCNEYERLQTSLEREKELRIRQSELYRYRYNGITKLDDCRHFEQHAAMATHRSTGPYGHGKTDNTHPYNGGHRPLNSSLHSPPVSQRKVEPSSGVEASSSSIAPKSMHHTADPTYSGGLLHNRSYLDSCRGSSAATTMIMPTMTTTTTTGLTMGMMTMDSAITAKAATSTATMMAAQASLPMTMPMTTAAKANQQHQQLLQQGGGGVRSLLPPPPQLQLNDVSMGQQCAAVGASNHNAEEPTMSLTLRAQLEEVKRLPQPLGSNLLSHNELDICKKYNITPTTYLSLKTVYLSGAPALNNPPAMEISLRKFFIKCGWLSH
ncbi:transcriptional adapter 2B isoform X1 [Scaptodrosophila lebanonensis]|uniref:Transcriptional adapter n=1 Tax=Drosophila lebanonensis TaxID=7225 RepID=A0A6J2T681_DROLE|nr:transcriptional adapter 2B isoform X1 [Scaptodrosophila lebanonensis]